MDSSDAPPATPRVLIVEDDAEIRRLLRRILGHLVIEIAECGSGAEALAAFTPDPPALVLMDLGLPDVDGISLTRQMRTAEPSVLVLVVTNHDKTSLRRAAVEAGACGYVLKDDLLRLQAIVPQLLSAGPARAGPACE